MKKITIQVTYEIEGDYKAGRKALVSDVKELRLGRYPLPISFTTSGPSGSATGRVIGAKVTT